MHLRAILLGLGVVACTPILDIDGFDYGVGGGGGITPNGGAGGMGGSASSGGGGVGGGGAPGVGGTGGMSGWLAPGFERRRALTVDNPSDADHADTPILVALDDMRVDYAAAQATGADIRFFADDGTALPHEIENWDTTGTSHVWVSVPTLPQAGTTIWMYSVSPGAPDAQSPAAVWADDFVTVWHLDPGLGDSIGGQDLTDGSSTDTTGVVGRARSFNMSNAHLDVGLAPATDDLLVTGLTIEAWIHPTDWGGGFSRIIDKATDGTGGDGFVFFMPPDGLGLRRDVSSSDGVWMGETNSVMLDQWQHVALVFSDAEGALFYVDGAPIMVTETTTPSGTPRSDVGTSMRIANNVTTAERAFIGMMDEVRISSVRRSAAWLAVQHASMTDALITYGDEETP